MKNQQNSTIQLFKIIVGVAWIDGKVQTQEKDYLRRLAQEQGIEKDPEIYPLIHGLKEVSTEECYQWITDFVGKNPNRETLNQLIEDISGLVYSDGEMDTAEAKILNNIQNMMAQPQLSHSLNSKIVHKLKGYYKKYATL